MNALMNRVREMFAPVPTERKQWSVDCTRWTARQWRSFWGDQRAQLIPNVPGADLLTVLPASYFTTPDFRVFANEVKNIQEVIRWPLYAYKAYATTGHTELQFFDQTEGSATNGRADTNMKSIGQLPGNQMQVVVGLRVVVLPARVDQFAVPTATAPVAPGEWWNVLTLNSWLEVVISDKEYMVFAPLLAMPQGFGAGTSVGGNAATQMSQGTVSAGTPDNGAIFHIDPPFGILPVRPFKALLKWRALQTVTTAGRIGVIFDGWNVRAVL